jgi:hypothetical protein
VTEAEWLASGDSDPMLHALEARGRKIRLYALACCRRIWDRLDDATRSLVLAAEQYSDGGGSGSDLLNASRLLQEQGPPYPSPGWHAVRAVIDAACPRSLEPHGEYSIRQALEVGRDVARSLLPPESTRRSIDYWEVREWKVEAAGQAALVRDIFGNPFCPVAFSPAWRTDTAVTIAQQMYESRDFAAMPILADALQDAGCDSDDVLNHCRGEEPHVRGCWVVDLVLGRE